MKNKELFEKTVSILVKAFQNDTLQYTNCKACAVGNIVAANNNVNLSYDKENRCIVSDNEEYNTGKWFNVFKWGMCGRDGLYLDLLKQKDIVQQIKSTGYSINEIADIELTFGVGCGNDGLNNFEGLMSVVDCLMAIHECDKSEADKAKSLFVKETV